MAILPTTEADAPPVLARVRCEEVTPLSEQTSFRAVVHLDDEGEARQRAVLRNVMNLSDDLGPDAVIELVTHGPGVFALLATGSLVQTVNALAARGIGLCACANTMRQYGLDVPDLVPMARIVPSGIGHLVRRQKEGWAYVHP